MAVDTSLATKLLDDNAFAHSDKFSLLNMISRSKQANDLAILVAMRIRANEWGEYKEIAIDMVRAAGLFPYLTDTDSLSLRNLIAKNYFRSPSGRDAFMHRAQYSVLAKLLRGESIILSAPTSFGKTFIVDELLLSGKYDNVMIVVPTIALIEEIRRRVKRLELPHFRISFSGQGLSDKNIFIVTQERAHEMLEAITHELGELDLLVIDEFYKMDKQLLSKEEKNSGDRADLLSVVYREYSSHSKQVYLLGPHLNGANGYDTKRHKPTWIELDNNTTYLEFIRKKADHTNSRGAITKQIIQDEKSDLMVYCSSPDQIKLLYNNYLKNIFESNDDNSDLIAWISENIASNWYVVDALRSGIGIHHGRLPRFICQEMIRRFEDGRVKVLLCTSTVIEGVNTNARAVVIYNNSKAFSAGYLTFRNIAGRAGRMFKHFRGKVYCFEEPIRENSIEVNDPIGTDSSDASPSLLNLLDEEHLSQKQKDNVKEHRTTTDIPLYLQRLNHFISLDQQEKTVSTIKSQYASVLSGIRGPELTRNQIIVIYMLISMLGLSMSRLVRSRDEERGAYRAAALTQAFLAEGTIGLAKGMRQDGQINDETIEQALEFMRNAIGYRLPKYVRALDRLKEYALGPGSGALDPFANRLEFLNTEPIYVQLDELGLPIELSKKYRLPSESLDQAAKAVERIRNSLNGFERYVVDNFIESY